MRRMLLLAGFAVALAAPAPARAQPALDGYLIATSGCPATPSIRRAGNPGDIRLEVDRAYRLLARNTVPGTHFLIRVPGASPERRWVDMACGTRVMTVDEVPVLDEDGEAPDRVAAPPAGSDRPAAGGGSVNNLLAISWQPAFCETRPGKVECVSQTAERFDATNFSLHGLWPQPRERAYCRVEAAVKRLDASPAGWARLPEPEIAADTRESLDRVMPGTQSALDRHEWVKHGSCYGDAEDYFADSVLLMDAINASPARALLASRIGERVTSDEIRAAFDAGFGAGAGERIRIACEKDGDREIIGEITVGLVGEIASGTSVGALILAARPTKPGCPAGIVDPVGLQ